MVTVAMVSPGFMGAGLGWALRSGGARVVATIEGRSERTRRLAADAGLELLPTLDDVVSSADVVLSVTPPAEARAAARAVAAAAHRTGARPIFADLNAVAPTTMAAIAEEFGAEELVDGAISGPPPTARPGARLYLSGVHAAAIAALPWADKIEPIVLGTEIGSASALKMCTASVYKGLTAIVTQAMRVAGRHGVLDEVLADLARDGLDRSGAVPASATKAHRFVAEMREIAATQADAGLTAALFEAFAEVYADVATTALAQGDPETTRGISPAETVAGLAKRE